MWKRISFELSKMTKFDHHIPLTWHQKVVLKRNRLELIFRCASLKNGWGTISKILTRKNVGVKLTFRCNAVFDELSTVLCIFACNDIAGLQYSENMISPQFLTLFPFFVYGRNVWPSLLLFFLFPFWQTMPCDNF